MRPRIALANLLLIAAAATASPEAFAREPAGLHDALDGLSKEGKFSGAVVVRDAGGIQFARGYGPADPFEGRAFTPDTPADSASLAKPVTSAAILLLAAEGRIELDAHVQHYLSEYPHPATTVRHLLSHSAGLDLKETSDGLANKSNADLLAESAAPLFPPGSAFTYCNLCSVTLALLIERVTGTHYLEFVKRRLELPAGVTLRPQRLADWKGRAIGYRRNDRGGIERFDSWEGELLYGAANLSISARQLADWGSEWWKPKLRPIRGSAISPANAGQGRTGLTLGNWYCALSGRRCHYLGHHEGFHHMLYWDADRRVSIAMLSNNALAPGLQQRLQRALVAFVDGQPKQAMKELAAPMPDLPVPQGQFALASGETVDVLANGKRLSVRRANVEYPAYPIGSGIRYVPGLDLYLAGSPDGRLQWLTLYEDLIGTAETNR